MGATTFTNVGKGKDAGEAFDRLTQQAQWQHGHGGYTGTIAEKDSFVEFARPKGMRRETVRRVVDALGGYVLPAPMRPSIRFGQDEKYRDAIRSAYPKMPISRMFDIYDDKWGPALCIELSKGEYIFAGFASE